MAGRTVVRVAPVGDSTHPEGFHHRRSPMEVLLRTRGPGQPGLAGSHDRVDPSSGRVNWLIWTTVHWSCHGAQDGSDLLRDVVMGSRKCEQ